MSALIWLVLVLYQIRRFINEPFVRQKHADNRFLALIKAHKNELAICFVAASLSASAFYMTFVFMPTLLSSVLKNYTHQQSVWITLVSLAVYFVTLPVFGALADRVGITKQIGFAALLYLIFSYVCFDLIKHLNVIVIFCSIVFFPLVQSLFNSALPAFMGSLFPAMHRGKALALSYNTSLALFGGLMPYVILSHGSYINPGMVISICALLTLFFLQFVRK